MNGALRRTLRLRHPRFFSSIRTDALEVVHSDADSFRNRGSTRRSGRTPDLSA